MHRWLLCCVWSLAAFASVAHAAKPAAVAVTDLTYESRVKEFFRYVELHQKADAQSSNHGQAAGLSSSSNSSHKTSTSTDYVESAGTYTYIDRGELRKFTADIKGEMLKSRMFRITQAKPYLRPVEGKSAKSEKSDKLPGMLVDPEKPASEKIYDIIERIKQGYYPNADYVLFGTLSNIEFRDELQPIQGSSAGSRQLSLDLVADFSLINTRTYEIKAAFSAIGEAQDTRLVGQPGQVVRMNRSKVISETSKSLAEDVIKQLVEQVSPGSSVSEGDAVEEQSKQKPKPKQGPVTVFR